MVRLHVIPGAASMWDLTVSTVHDFAVGDGAFVVHNCGGGVNESYKVWNRITPLADDIPGTRVPGRFMLQSGSKSFEVVPNATKHMGEYLTREGTAGVDTYRRATYMLDSFSQAVDEASSFVKSGERWFGSAGGWELGIDGADNHIFHARPMW